jgi:hypothetical protein
LRTQLACSAAFAACALFYSSMAMAVAQQAPADPRPPLQAPQAPADPRPPLDESNQAPPDPRPSRAADQPAAGSLGQSGHKPSGADTTGQGKSDAPPPRIDPDQSPKSKDGKGQAQ